MKARLIIFLIIYFIFSSINLINYGDLFLKQMIWYIIGIIIVFIMKNKYIKYVYICYFIFNILLLYLLLFGDSINGSRAWINIFNISIQPSEFMKVILIILLSIIITKYDKYKLKCIIITIIPSILTFLEPDTGNVIFYFIILISAYIYKMNNKYKILKVVGIVGSILIIISLLIIINKSILINILGSSFLYRFKRITDLINNTSFQLNRSLINIGTCGLFGTSDYLYIPEETTDFAFTYLIHNIGILGIILFLSFNIIVNFNILAITNKSSGIIKSISFITLIVKLSEESIHELMNIGLFPITGITLPFISYGGSSIISFILLLSLIFNSNKDYNMDMGFD
jgi:rod shape determining protein RodA